LSKNINILDGGFGQAIINKGLDQIGTLWGCSAYLNEKDHQKVLDTHLEFINAGSKTITTSNFTIRKRRLAQNKLETRLKDFLEISGRLAQEAVNISNKDIEIAGSLPTRGETYKSDVFLSDEELLKEFYESASIIDPYVDLFYLDVLCCSKEIEIALESIKSFNKDAIVGIHLKDSGLLPSGETITDLKNILSEYKIRAVIGGCISPEIYQKVSNELKELNYNYGFKVNAFQSIPDDWSITPNANPNLSLGKRPDLDSDKFVEFCKTAIKDGASFVGGCCEINHNHIKALSNEL
jgi:homocysteine S-methyltransferase